MTDTFLFLFIFIILIAIFGVRALIYINTIGNNFTTADSTADSTAAMPPNIETITGGKETRKRKLQPSLRKKDLVKHPRSKAEAVCIGILKELTGLEFPTVYTDWLFWKGHALELDGYNEDAKLALEFSGPLHTKWNPRSEPYEKYYERIVRDIVKIRVCKKHGVDLIVVDMSLPKIHWRDYLASRLFDFGRGPRPINYIEIQTPEVYRNEQIEKELGLNDYIIAMKI